MSVRQRGKKACHYLFNLGQSEGPLWVESLSWSWQRIPMRLHYGSISLLLSPSPFLSLQMVLMPSTCPNTTPARNLHQSVCFLGSPIWKIISSFKRFQFSSLIPSQCFLQHCKSRIPSKMIVSVHILLSYQ